MSANIYEPGPNVVTLNVDEAYFFVMNMFIHDPCIHDFNLNGLGAKRTAWVNSLFEEKNPDGSLHVASAFRSTGGGQAGGADPYVLKAGDAEHVYVELGKNIEDEKAKSIDCILKAFDGELIGEVELNVIIQELAKEFPGITKYDIINVDRENKIDQEVKNGFYEMDKLFRRAAAIGAKNAQADEGLFGELDMYTTTNNIKVMIIDAIENGGNFENSNCEDITTGIQSLNGEKIRELQDWFRAYIGPQQGGGAGINDNVSRINNVIQKGGTVGSPGIDLGKVSPAKMFLINHKPLIYYDKGNIPDWMWFTDPLPTPQDIILDKAVEGGIFTSQLKFKNIFADNLIKALQYFDPDNTIKYEDIIKTTIDNDNKIQTTIFQINDSQFDQVLTKMLLCLERMKSLWPLPEPSFLVLPPDPVAPYTGPVDMNTLLAVPTLLKDLPDGLFTPIEDNSENFLLFSSPQLTNARAAAKVVPTDTMDKFSTELPKIFSDKWEDQNDYLESVIEDSDENDYIRISWFLYELSNCLIIYNYLYMLVNVSPTRTGPFIVTKVERKLGWRWHETSANSRALEGAEESYVLIVNLELTGAGVDGEGNTLSSLPDRLGEIESAFKSSEVVAGGKFYIQALYAKLKQPRGKTPVLTERSKNLVNLSLDCVVYSVLAALKGVPDGNGAMRLFYQKVLNAHFTPATNQSIHSPLNNDLGNGARNDSVIMTAYLDLLNQQQRDGQGNIVTPSPLLTNYDNALVDCSAVPQIALTAPTKAALSHFNQGPDIPNELVSLLNGGGVIPNEYIIYINNAAQNIYDSPNNVGTTNIASVIDPQSTFPKFLKSSDEELGNMDITIKSPNNEIFYRVRVRIITVDPDSGELHVQIDAYLKIAGIVLVYLDGTPTRDLSGVYAHQRLDMNQFTLTTNKLQASKIFKEIVTKVTDLFCSNEQRVDPTTGMRIAHGGKINPEMVYKYLSGINLPSWDGAPREEGVAGQARGNRPIISPTDCRRLIIETSFKKGLGDFLQEVLGWAPNRGYTEVQELGKRKNNIRYDIKQPTQVVIQLNNDTPSGLRGVFFNNMRQKDRFWGANSTAHRYKSICGYLYTKKLDWDVTANNTTLYKRQWKVKYAVQGFDPDVTYPQGGGGKKKGGQKTKKKRRVKYSTIRRKSKKTRTSRRKRRKRRRHTTRN